jgi:hypothetical protein
LKIWFFNLEIFGNRNRKGGKTMAEKWNLNGTYFEACNCDVGCPCVFLSPPTTGECKALLGWHIDKGSFGDVTLEELNVALYVHSPGNMVEGNWKVALYLDERASDSQKDGLTQIFAGQAGGHPAMLASFMGEVLGVKSTPIEYKAEGKRRRLRIPDVADAEIEALAGQGDAEVTISNQPLAVTPGQTLVVSKSKRVSYNDYGLQLEVSDKNGFYSPFTYQSS